MTRRRVTLAWLSTATACAILALPVRAAAQELEPGAYWPIPSGVNVITIANSVNWGDVAFDPSAPIDEATATINTTALAFTRAFGLFGRAANVGVLVPIVSGHIEGLYLGEPAAADRFGQGDVRLRIGINLFGAPAMTPKAFASYTPRGIVGVSLSVVPPLGQYDSAKPINIGTNRWAFKPEVGVSRGYGPWLIEGMAGLWLFTSNDEFFGGRTREQEPIGAVQLHVTYKFTRTIWLAGDANYFRGGQTAISGRENFDLQSNSRVGATFSTVLTGPHAIRVSVSTGAYTTIGADFTSIGFSYNYAWVR